jgi:hypothetical protein
VIRTSPPSGWVIAALVATLLLVSAAPVAAASRAYTAQYRGEYALRYDNTDTAGDYQRVLQTLTWTERVYTEVSASGETTSTKTLKAQGTLIENEQQGVGFTPPPPPTSVRCTVTEVKTGQPYLTGLFVSPPGPGHEGLGVGAMLPDAVPKQLTPSGPPDRCQFSGAWLLSNPWDSSYSDQFPADAQTKMFNGAFGAFAEGLPVTGGIKRYDAEQAATVQMNSNPPSTEKISRSMHSVISTGAGSPPLGTGNGAPAGPPPKPTQAAKEAARRDLRPALDSAAGPCLQEGLTLGLVGAGVLVSGSGAIIGGTLVVAGALTAPIAAPLCTAGIERVVADYRIYKDPPLAGIHMAARPVAVHAPTLPSCARHRGRLRRFCAGLRTENAGLVKAARHTAAVAKALQTTVGRATAAKAAGDASAIALQEATAKRLSVQFRQALAAQAGAGRRVARRLRGANLRLRLSTKQSAAAIRVVLARLAPKAITAADLTPVAARALRPGPVDLLKRLANP